MTLGSQAGQGPGPGLQTHREEIRVPITANRIRKVDGKSLGTSSWTTFSQGAGLASGGGRAGDREGGRGIVIDLRDNGGGLLEEAVFTSSVFLDEGDVVVETRSRESGQHHLPGGQGKVDSPPLVVLVNRNTASAAEILAAALQTDLDTPVVGTRTFGRVSSSRSSASKNGGALDLSVGEFLTADGVSLAGKGLKPDVYAPPRRVPGATSSWTGHSRRWRSGWLTGGAIGQRFPEKSPC